MKTMDHYPVVYTVFVNNDGLTTDSYESRYVAYFANRPSAS